jgi:predicted MFS family arabinose efflux permease
VLLGGVLTGMLSWRWVFFINIPIGLAVLAGSGVLAEGRRNSGRLDSPGALSGTLAMVALAYGITHAAEHGWTDPVTLGSLGTALVLILLFLWLQARGAHPMLPLGLFKDRNRSGSYATMLFVGAGLMGTFYLLALYLQQVLRFSPVWTGVASLPFSAGIILGASISSKLVERISPRLVAGPGLLVAALGMFWLSALTVDVSYAAHIMPALFITSFGLGMAAVTVTLTAVHGIAEDQAGVASALVNMAQQVGAALGLAVFTTISISASNRLLPGAVAALQEGLAGQNPGAVARAGEVLTHGYTTAFLAGAGMLLIAAAVVMVAINTKRTQETAA